MMCVLEAVPSTFHPQLYNITSLSDVCHCWQAARATHRLFQPLVSVLWLGTLLVLSLLVPPCTECCAAAGEMHMGVASTSCRA